MTKLSNRRNFTSYATVFSPPSTRGILIPNNILIRNQDNRRVMVAISQSLYRKRRASVRLTKRSTRGLAYCRCSSSSQIKIKNKGGSAPLNPLSYKKNLNKSRFCLKTKLK